ncbi:MAG TPA: hypothetical protein VH187_04855, partial [Scandinavium sp.]
MKTGRSGIVELIYGDRKKRRRRKLWICLWIGCATTQKAQSFDWAFHLFDAWQFPTLAWGDPTLPSALRRFTSEFGMG